MPVPAAIELKRHYRQMSEKHTDEVVEIVADLFVGFVQGRRQDAPRDGGRIRAAGQASSVRSNQARQEVT